MRKRTEVVGRMRHRVTYQTPVEIDRLPTPAGVPPQDAEQTWVDGATYWASVEPLPPRRSVGVDAPAGEVWYLVTMRNPAPVAITAKGRFLYRGRVLAIDSVQRVDELPAYLDVEVKETPA